MQTQANLKQQNPEYVTVIQITDTHIQADPKDDFDGVDTRDSLEMVLQHIGENETGVDAILATGDLVHDPVTEAYEVLADILAQTRLPVFCIPGNHDNPEIMAQCLNKGNISTAKHLLFDHWHICLLDSWIPDTHAGYLSGKELEFLGNNLAANQDRYALVVLHHPPVSINSPWMDKMALKNPGDLFSIIDNFKQVKAVLWGHIHQEFNSKYKNIVLLATPSTCVQFAPEAMQYRKDPKNPGYRVLHLYNNGKLQSSVCRTA